MTMQSNVTALAQRIAREFSKYATRSYVDQQISNVAIKDINTGQFVNVWRGTKSQYNAIPSYQKRSDVMYFILE